MGRCSIDGCANSARRRGLCWTHYQAWLDADPDRPRRIVGNDTERFLAKVDRSGDCWLWTATINASGYGSFSFGKTAALAHRASFELFVRRIAEGMELDHLCEVRHCVNPAHLEEVTHAENVRRTAQRQARRDAGATHCPRGHEFTPENTKSSAQGTRSCRQCSRDYHREYQRNWKKVRSA